MTDAQKKALEWLTERGGSAAFAKTKLGGHYWLARGEICPCTYMTIKALVDAGKAKYERCSEGKIIRVTVL